MALGASSGIRGFRIPSWIIVIACLAMILYLATVYVRDERLFFSNGDIHQYQDTAVALLGSAQEHGDAAYYPPLANVLFVVTELNPFTIYFHRSLHMMMLLALTLSVLFIMGWMRRDDLRWLIFSILTSIVLLEPSVFFARFDFFPMLAVLLACLSHRRKLYEIAGAFLMAGILLKLSPAFLLPLFLVLTPKPSQGRFWTGMFIAIVLTATLGIALTGTQFASSVLDFVQLRTGHPPYALSTASSIDLFLRMMAGGKGHIQWMDPNLGHFNVGMPSWVPMALLLLSLIGSVWIAVVAKRKASDAGDILPYAATVLLWVLFTTPLLTMHYYLWVLPLIVYWLMESLEQRSYSIVFLGTVLILACGIALLGQYFYPHAYFRLVDYQTHITVTLNLVRNLLVLALFWLMLSMPRKQRNA